MVLHCTGLTGGSSAKHRTGSVALDELVPLWCMFCLQKDPLTAPLCFVSSLNTRKVSATHSQGVQGQGCCWSFPMLYTSEEISVFQLMWPGQQKGKDGKKKWLAYFVLFWGVGSQVWQQRSCPAATLVSRRFLSSNSIELCGGRAAAGGWGWIPREGRKAGKCLLTSQETGRVFKKLKWMSVPPKISQKTYHAAF